MKSADTTIRLVQRSNFSREARYPLLNPIFWRLGHRERCKKTPLPSKRWIQPWGVEVRVIHPRLFPTLPPSCRRVARQPADCGGLRSWKRMVHPRR